MKVCLTYKLKSKTVVNYMSKMNNILTIDWTIRQNVINDIRAIMYIILKDGKVNFNENVEPIKEVNVRSPNNSHIDKIYEKC